MRFYITLFKQNMLRTQFYIEFKESAFSKHFKLNKKKALEMQIILQMLAQPLLSDFTP